MKKQMGFTFLVCLLFSSGCFAVAEEMTIPGYTPPDTPVVSTPVSPSQPASSVSTPTPLRQQQAPTQFQRPTNVPAAPPQSASSSTPLTQQQTTTSSQQSTNTLMAQPPPPPTSSSSSAPLMQQQTTMPPQQSANTLMAPPPPPSTSSSSTPLMQQQATMPAQHPTNVPMAPPSAHSSPPVSNAVQTAPVASFQQMMERPSTSLLSPTEKADIMKYLDSINMNGWVNFGGSLKTCSPVNVKLPNFIGVGLIRTIVELGASKYQGVPMTKAEVQKAIESAPLSIQIKGWSNGVCLVTISIPEKPPVNCSASSADLTKAAEFFNEDPNKKASLQGLVEIVDRVCK